MAKPTWFVNSLAPGGFGCDHKKKLIFNLALLFGFIRAYYNVLRRIPQDLTDDVNIGSGNGLVPLGNKPLP